jgi:endonuclease/exonuclease/phosphatase family metal-dependent hydrolase
VTRWFIPFFYSAVILLAYALYGCGTQPSLSAANDAFASQPHVTLGSFNLLRLGQTDQVKNYQRMVSIIHAGDFDVFAGLEIMKADAAKELLTALQEDDDPDWQLLLSAKANGASAYKEFLGYYYRSDRVEPAAGSHGFCTSSYAAEPIENGCFVKDSDSSPQFERDPFIGHFKKDDYTFTLASVHLYYGAQDTEKIQVRKDEALALRKVLDKIRTTTPDDDVFAMGDFNLELGSEQPSAEAVNQEIPKEFLTGPSSSSVEIYGLIDGPTTIGFSSYDHIFYYSDNYAALIDGSDSTIVDFKISSSEMRSIYKGEVSDHYPVKAKFLLP